jgi:glycosyltransferase involved in cell wall biosynthesis
MEKRHRVLLIAEAANPEWTSVPLIGWSLSRALAKVADVHLVTQIRNRDAIVRAGLNENSDFTAIDNERLAAPLSKLGQKLPGGYTTYMALSSLAYYSFEYRVWAQFKARLAERQFDLVHRITPLSPTNQSIIARRLSKIGIPFIVGPLNGGVPWPRHFMGRQHAEREWLSHIRGIYRFMPAYHSTRHHSAAIIVGSRHTCEEMPAFVRHKCIYIPENGVDWEQFSNPGHRRGRRPLRAAFVGRLVPYKGADILVEAAAEFLRQGKLELHIIGDGAQRALLEELVRQLGIQRQVHFHGWIAHTDIPDKLRECDFMVLPSIREFGGGVVVEAMALGVMPIVANYAGPSELVDDGCGIRVSFRDKNSLIKGVNQAIAKVISSPQILDELGEAGRQKVREMLTWEAKANQISSIYDAVLACKKNLNYLSVKLVEKRLHNR